MRPLARTDYLAGHLDTLRALTTVGEITEAQWTERYEWMKARADEYYVLVVCDGAGKVVGTGCVVVERKLWVGFFLFSCLCLSLGEQSASANTVGPNSIHNLGLVGHIEDIVVRKDQQGKKLGLRIIEALDHIAKEVGCYKVRGGPPFLAPCFLFSNLHQ